MVVASGMTPDRPPAHPGLSRREAILLSLGQHDKVALARDQQAAIEGALGPQAAAEEPVAASDDRSSDSTGSRLRLRMVRVGLAFVVLLLIGILFLWISADRSPSDWIGRRIPW